MTWEEGRSMLRITWLLGPVAVLSFSGCCSVEMDTTELAHKTGALWVLATESPRYYEETGHWPMTASALADFCEKRNVHFDEALFDKLAFIREDNGSVTLVFSWATSPAEVHEVEMSTRQRPGGSRP